MKMRGSEWPFYHFGGADRGAVVPQIPDML